jgi:hypothetical protein
MNGAVNMGLGAWSPLLKSTDLIEKVAWNCESQGIVLEEVSNSQQEKSQKNPGRPSIYIYFPILSVFRRARIAI